MLNEIGEIRAWIELADDDYIAARTLIRNGHLVPGNILAHSAVEKYFKTVLRILEVEFSTRGKKAHNLIDLYRKLQSHDSKINMNESYLDFLVKIYEIRYPDRLEKEFNLAMDMVKSLVGLDETIFKIRNKISIKYVGSESKTQTKFDLFVEKKFEPLMQGNHAFGEANRENLFKESVRCYEFRILSHGSWLAVDYISNSVEDDGVYLLEGLRPGKSDKEFILQSAAIDSPQPDITKP